MDRAVLLIAVVLGVLGAALAPIFPPTAALPRLLVFLVCALGGFLGLWVVSYALSLE
ncbi:hypothetical protein [Halalkalicoccus ordinarius]|uniref:hypothetical protein n=1 Tax=Halalkalicoccus ordinarius TaxID=3116651 RepID=UPI00300E9E61